MKRDIVLLAAWVFTLGFVADVAPVEAADAGPPAAEGAGTSEAPDLSGLDVPPAPPIDVPGGRPSLVLLLAFLINRALWLLKKGAGSFFPERLHPYLPLIAAGLGLAYAVVENVTQGTPWTWAILTGIAGSTGAVAWREGTRAMAHATTRTPPKAPPKDPKDMTDDELADAVKRP